MFDSLLGGKFSKKCKHCVKCINSRILQIRKKRQATVRFLKKDVADLLASGHDLNAFGRIDALIVEINRASCYDMIEQYCQCILNQLPSLQKQRVCPEEAVEAVSTLISAAARFSDLPELCDLRGVFTERYGSHMESSVNAEFVEKYQKKSFSMERKVRLMKDIAEEFSVRWDSKVFQQKLSNPAALPSGGGSFNRRKEVVLNADIAANGRRRTIINSDVAVNKRNEAAFGTNGDLEVHYKERWEPSPRSSVQKQQVHPEPKDIHVIPIISNGRSHDPSEMTRKVYTASKETENVQPVADNGAAHAYVKDTGTQNGKVNDDCLKLKACQNEGITRSRSPIPQDGPGLIGLQRQHAGHVISGDAKAVNMIPPDNKFKGSRNEGDHVDSLPKSEKGLDPTLQPVDSKNARPMSMIPPPYTKPNFRTPPADADDTKLTGTPINISSTADCERSNGGDKAKPVSVRRRLPKPSAVIDTNNAIDDPKPVVKTTNDRYAEEIVHRPRGKSGEEVHGSFNSDQNVHDTSSGRRKHGGRRSNAMYDGDCDEEEEVMDRLLLHLSKKVINNESVKRRTRTTTPPAKLVTDASRDHEHYGNGRSHYRTERVASFPAEPKSPAVEVSVGRGTFRATSMQPDMLSPNGANHGIPDYDDLAARFNTLKRGGHEK